MSSNPLRLQKLFEKYLSDTCTPRELTEFWQLVGDFSDNDILTEALRKVWLDESAHGDPSSAQRKERAFRRILEQAQGGNGSRKISVRRLPRLRRYGVAAVISGMLIAGGWMVRHTPAPSQGVSIGRVADDVAPGGNNAVLTLANGREINLDTAGQGVIARTGSASVVKGTGGHLSYQDPDRGALSGENLVFNRLSTPRGGQYKLLLSDGTKVWLNALSSISFPVAFSARQRSVTVTGEVYFEVAPDAHKPFLVTVGQTTVQVLGTHFNINAYQDEPESRTTLLEGSIRVVTQSRDHGPASVLMKPGDQLRMTPRGTMRLLSGADTDESVAWKDGLFVFHNDELPQVMRRIARWYNVAIVYDTDKVAKSHVTGSINRNENLSRVLQMLTLAVGSDFEIEGREVIVKSL